MSDISGLQGSITALTQVASDIRSVVQTNIDINIQVIGMLERLAAQLAAMEPTQEAVDRLTVEVATAVLSLQTSKDRIVEQNGLLQTEMVRIDPSTPV